MQPFDPVFESLYHLFVPQSINEKIHYGATEVVSTDTTLFIATASFTCGLM